jgi:single-strand DNA-binding protein
MLNKCVLIGRLTKDPDLRYTTSGTAVAKFTLAVDRPRRADSEKETDFIPVVAWGKTAENCANYIGKGSLVAVEGRIQVRTYEAKDGGKRWATEVVAGAVHFLDKRGERAADTNVGGNEIGHEVEYDDDSIPF